METKTQPAVQPLNGARLGKRLLPEVAHYLRYSVSVTNLDFPSDRLYCGRYAETPAGNLKLTFVVIAVAESPDEGDGYWIFYDELYLSNAKTIIRPVTADEFIANVAEKAVA
jgi:hypothetical protein